MQQSSSTPLTWLQQITTALQWPVVVIAAFWIGRSITKLEVRVLRAEKSMSDLLERHMPHVHNALAEIRGLIQGMRK